MKRCIDCVYSSYSIEGLACYPPLKNTEECLSLLKERGYHANHFELALAMNIHCRNCKFYKRKWWKFWRSK